jgi:hypothetical protein
MSTGLVYFCGYTILIVILLIKRYTSRLLKVGPISKKAHFERKPLQRKMDTIIFINHEWTTNVAENTEWSSTHNTSDYAPQPLNLQPETTAETKVTNLPPPAVTAETEVVDLPPVVTAESQVMDLPPAPTIETGGTYLQSTGTVETDPSGVIANECTSAVPVVKNILHESIIHDYYG